MYVTSGFWITFIPHASCTAGEPRGAMRQYVPIIFPLILFHSYPSSIFRPLSLSHSFLPSLPVFSASVTLSAHIHMDHGCKRRPRGTYCTCTFQLWICDLELTPRGHFISERAVPYPWRENLHWITYFIYTISELNHFIGYNIFYFWTIYCKRQSKRPFLYKIETCGEKKYKMNIFWQYRSSTFFKNVSCNLF